jgi:hypothetical protein
MYLAKPIFVLAIVALLGVYAFDCEAITTPEQAMRCCNSMPCSPQDHHEQDCCKTMPSMLAPFVQPVSLDTASFASIVFAVLRAFGESPRIDLPAGHVSAQFHAPPIVFASALAPLRI